MGKLMPQQIEPTELHVIIPLRDPLVDPRGTIRNLLDQPLGSVAVITSVKGAIRGNHYHKTDAHYCWLQEGGLIYLQRPVGSTAPPQRWVITPGQLFYTPPGVEHAMHFTADSTFYVFGRNPRRMAEYEADLVRIPPLNP